MVFLTSIDLINFWPSDRRTVLQAPTLTASHVVRSVKDAVASYRLGIQTGATEPLPLYPNGTVCAFSASLPLQVLEEIIADGNAKLNWLQLMRVGYFSVADLQTVEVLSVLQLGYDACFISDEPDQDRKTRVRKFCDFVMSLDPNDLSDDLWYETDVHAAFLSVREYDEADGAGTLHNVNN